MRMRASDWQELFRPELAAFTIILNLGIGLHAVDVFVISTVMPTVVKDIGGHSFYAWSTMLYMVALDRGRFQRRAAEGRARAAQGLCPRRAAVPHGIGGLWRQPDHAGAADRPHRAGLRRRPAAGAVDGTDQRALPAGAPHAHPRHGLGRVGVAALVGPLVGGIFAEFHWWRGAFWASTPIILWFTARAWQTLPRTTAATDAAPFPIRRIGLARLRRAVRRRRRPGIGTCGPNPAGAGACTQGLLLAVALALTVQAFRLDGAAANRLFPPRPLGA